MKVGANLKNTTLCKVKYSRNVQKFGDTDFHLMQDKKAGRYIVLDHARHGQDIHDIVLSIPEKSQAEIQETFDTFYKGVCYGKHEIIHR